MNKLLCIVGPTATGKTQLAIYLSQLFPSILVSADSRQVYRGMDIVTGKDHSSTTKLAGVDLVEPGSACSVSVWFDAVMPQITRAWGEGKLPIVVGGTGLYVKALTHGIGTISVPINEHLRSQLATLSLTGLQLKLQSLDPAKFISMNHSDQNNPRRLIRAIEVAQHFSQSSLLSTNSQLPTTLIIGLRYFDDSNYISVVRKRVLVRLHLGALAETKRLLTSGSPQSLSAIGYRSLVSHLRGELDYASMVEKWLRDELAYAKRQLTWFRKLPEVKWHASDSLNPDQVATQVKAWYDKAT